jgi:hypothetical protein
MNLKNLEGTRPNIYLERVRKIMKTAVRIAGVPGEIQTKHLLNTSLECYFHTDLPNFVFFLWRYLTMITVLSLCNVKW